MRSARFVAVAGATLVLATAGAFPVSAQTEAESGQVIADLNRIAMEQLGAAEFPLPLWIVNQGMVHGAVYDAVVSITGGWQPYLGAIEAPDGASATAAAIGAARGVMVGLMPDREADVDAALAASLEAVPDGTAKDDGLAVGEDAAAAMLAARVDDGRGVPNPLTFGDGPGEYRPTPPDLGEFPASWIAKMKPFLAPSPEYYRTAGPRALDSAEYAAEYNEVHDLGGPTGTRTPEQETIARFWGGAIPQWSGAEQLLVAEHELDIATAARLFAIGALAASDAAIGCYDDKYHWMFWRPVTAIAEAADDGNDATEPDQAWVDAHEGSPPYPDHPSGFNCYSGAYAGAIEAVFGKDIPVTIPGDEAEPRTFDTVEQARLDVVEARILQGLHFRSADVQGSELGLKAAALAAERLAPIE